MLIGCVTAAHGVRGWVKVKSFTDPPDNLLTYAPWLLRARGGALSAVDVVATQRQGANYLAKFDGCDDRNGAEALKGTEIFVSAAQLAPLEAGEYYWRDLIGLAVCNPEGTRFGTVHSLMETGAHDVLVVRDGDEEVLMPFTEPYLREVRLQDRVIIMDWQADWS